MECLSGHIKENTSNGLNSGILSFSEYAWESVFVKDFVFGREIERDEYLCDGVIFRLPIKLFLFDVSYPISLDTD